MVNIHKEVYGQGKAIVLIHGWAMHTGIWRAFAQQLAQNYQVTCLDLPAHGLSDTVDPYHLTDINQALIQQFPKSPCCVLGWSLGATVALSMTQQFPERINRVILLAGNPHFVATEQWAGLSSQLLDEFSEKLSLNCQLTLIRFLSLQINRLPNFKTLLKTLKTAIHACPPPSNEDLHHALLLLKHTDLREALSTMTQPISLIQGDKDTLVPQQTAYDIKALQPACELNIITGAGHVPFLSHPDDVIHIINQFV